MCSAGFLDSYVFAVHECYGACKVNKCLSRSIKLVTDQYTYWCIFNVACVLA